MRIIDDVMADLQAIVNTAEGRSFTDDEVTRYEALETELESVRKSTEIRARQNAYNTPVNGSHLHVGTPRVDDGLSRAFDAYLRTGQANADISGLRVRNDQGEGTTTAGGYTVPTEFRQKLVEVLKAYGGLASAADSFTTGDGRPVEYPSINDTANQGDIAAEGAAVANGADLTFGTVTLGAYKYTSAGAGSNLPLRVSVELLQDSAFDIAGFVARAMGTRIARKQAAHWCTGTGVSQPLGIVGTATADKSLTTLSTITYSDLLSLEGLLDPAYEANAQWVMNKKTWNAMKGVVDGSSRPLILPQAEAGIGGGVPKQLLGYPVLIDQGMPDYNTALNKFAVLGDIRESYVIRNVSTLVVVVNPYTRAANGQVEYSGWMRADGNVQNRNAYVVLANHA